MGKFTLLTSITLDSAGFKTGTETVNNQIKTLKDGIKTATDSGKANFIQLAGAVNEPVRNLQELTRAYKELKNTSFAGKTPEEIEDIKNRMAGLIDEIGDYKAELNQKSLDPFQKIASGGAGITSMMGGVTSGLGLLGVKSEGLNVVMQRTVLLMGLSNGLQSASVFFQENALGIEMRLGLAKVTNLIRTNALKNIEIIQQRLATAATVEGATATGGLSSAMIALNTIIAANPIGVLVAGLVGLAAITAIVVMSLNTESEAHIRATTAIDGMRFSTEEATKAHNSSILKLQSLGDEYAVLTGKMSKTQQTINQLKRDHSAAIDEIKSDTEKKLGEVSGFWSTLWRTVAAGGNSASATMSTVDEIINIVGDGQKKIEDTNKEHNLLIKNENQKVQNDKKEARKKELSDALEFNNQLIREQLQGKNKELADLEDWKNKSIDKYKGYGNVVTTITDVYNNKVNNINKKYDTEALSQRNQQMKNLIGGKSLELAKKQLNSTISDTFNNDSFKPIELKTKVVPPTAEELESFRNNTALISQGLNGISDAFISMAETGKLELKGLTMSMLSSVRQVIFAKLAEAMAGMIAGESTKGLLGLVTAGVGIAGVMALFAKLPKFETGGIVGGNSYSGDNVLVRVNSGEGIISARQQANLFNLINNGGNNSGNNQNVRFEIQGDTLVGILDKVNKINGFR